MGFLEVYVIYYLLKFKRLIKSLISRPVYCINENGCCFYFSIQKDKARGLL